MINRRQLLQRCSALTGGLALSTLPSWLYGASAAESWKAEFHQALARDPTWLGWLGTDQDKLVSGPLSVRGKIPNGLRGTLYRNGPARHEIGEFRYHHWFDGDGMVQAFRIGSDQVEHLGRFVQTSKYQQERKAGRAMFSTFGTTPEHAMPVNSPDSINPANISVMAHHGKTYALWEAGSAYEFNADTLDTIGVKTFSPETMGVPFSAHPRIEPDGTLWNFGYLSSANTIVLWHIDAQGRLVKNGLIKADGITMIHDCIVTERSLILMIPPFHWQAESGDTFLAMHHWRGDQPTRVLVVDKNDFSSYRWHDLPAQWVFHFSNAFESEGVIHFDAARSPNADAVFGSLKEVMRGRHPSQPELPPTHWMYRIDTRAGRATEMPLGTAAAAEFPVMDGRLVGRRHHKTLLLTSTKAERSLALDSVTHVNIDNGHAQQFTYGASERPEEHLFVADPQRGPEQGGWILGTALDFQKRVTRLNIFAAEGLQDGPIASVDLPYVLPLGLHGKFVAT